MLKILSIISFSISGFFTVNLLLSNSNGIINGLLTIGMALIFEFSKCLFLYKSIESKVNNCMVKYGTWIVTGFLFGLSVLASLSFLQNETNETKNKAILKSSSYKMQLDNKAQLKDLYESKKSQITSLQEQTQSQIKALEKQRDSLPSNYLTKRSQVNDKIKELQSESQSNISKVNSELENISKESSKEIDVKGIEVNSTKGR